MVKSKHSSSIWQQKEPFEIPIWVPYLTISFLVCRLLWKLYFSLHDIESQSFAFFLWHTHSQSLINTLPQRQTDQYSLISHLVLPKFSTEEAAATHADTKYRKFKDQRQKYRQEVGVGKVLRMESWIPIDVSEVKKLNPKWQRHHCFWWNICAPLGVKSRAFLSLYGFIFLTLALLYLTNSWLICFLLLSLFFFFPNFKNT